MPDAPANQPLFLLLADDLMWTSRFSATGQAHGVAVRTARSPDRLLALAGELQPRCVILDLGIKGAPIAEMVTGLKAACPGLLRIVAYGSHVDAETLHAAREAGCSPVLPRSRMADELERLIDEWK